LENFQDLSNFSSYSNLEIREYANAMPLFPSVDDATTTGILPYILVYKSTAIQNFQKFWALSILAASGMESYSTISVTEEEKTTIVVMISGKFVGLKFLPL